MSRAVDGVLVVDVQRALVEGDHAIPGADALLQRLTETLQRARRAGVPVVHLQDNGVEDRLIRHGTPGWDLALDPDEGEEVVAKDVDDGFVDTELEKLLRERGVQRLLVVGVQSEMCVAATTRGALSRGFGVVLPHDGHLTYDIPDAGPGAPDVPAALVSRVAAWALGDEVEARFSLSEVDFAPSPTSREGHGRP